MKFLILLSAFCALALQAQASPKPWTKPQVPVLKGAKPASAINGQIVGGTQATQGLIPHQVLLNIDNAYLCGGSLISTKHVLTAAHCAYDRTSFRVTLGAQNRLLSTEANRIVLTSTTKAVHEKYNATTINNDVAIVFLPSAVTLNTYIKTVALPKASAASKSFDGVTATASGWGWTKDNGTASDQLMWVNMPIINNTVCKQTYGSLILNSTICTSGAGTKSTCRGDSGGPLTVVEAGVKTLVGVVSFGKASCQSGVPQAYARVTSFLTWINQKTGIAIAP